VTSAGSLLAYIENEWTEITPAKADIYFSQDWFDTKKVLYPQVVVTDLSENRLEQWTSGGSINIRNTHRLSVNVARFIKARRPGTVEVDEVENMKREINRILMHGWNKATKYGGSLKYLRIAMPWGPWTRITSIDVQPPMYRFELTVTGTEDIA